MIVIDSNPILRLILEDNKAQVKEINSFLKDNNVLVVTQVFFEIEYVLRKVYKVPKKEVCDILDKVLMISGIVVEEKEDLATTLELYRQKNVDMVDAYLWVRAKELGTTVFTFDRDFKKFS